MPWAHRSLSQRYGNRRHSMEKGLPIVTKSMVGLCASRPQSPNWTDPPQPRLSDGRPNRESQRSPTTVLRLWPTTATRQLPSPPVAFASSVAAWRIMALRRSFSLSRQLSRAPLAAVSAEEIAHWTVPIEQWHCWKVVAHVVDQLQGRGDFLANSGRGNYRP